MGNELASTLSGLTITQNDAAYEVKTVGKMVFNEKYYHMPIPYAEITKNNKLLQNEGYY
ncbi:hypothetical protein D3C78_1863070 [compost metagenome]